MTRDELLAGYLETGAFDEDALAALPAGEQAEVRAEQEAMDRLRAELGNEDLWAEPDDDFADRLFSLVLAEPAGIAPAAPAERAEPAAAPSATAAPPAAGAEVVSLAEARARRSRLVAVGASIVAAAAVVVAVIAFSTRSSGNGGEVASPPTSSTTSTAPIRELDVKGTELAPGAAGTVKVQETDSGVRIDLDVPGLERRDNGEFYQAWIRTPQGLVPIGTFHTGTDVTLWSGIELDDSLAITVTLEQNDGNQESSGQRVIVVPLQATPPGSSVPGTGSSVPGASVPGSTTPR